LRVVFASNRGTSFDLYAADRPDRASAFANLRLLNDVNTLAAEEKPALSADELEIVFSSDRPGTGMLDLWHATRPSVDQPFGPAEELTVLNGPSDEYAPYLSADGTRLYYSYNVETTGGPDDADVWVATRSRSCL
jgi:Tol biopolymer transport system component